MATDQFDLDLALGLDRSLNVSWRVAHNLDRQEAGCVFDRMIRCKSRVFQPVENLIGIDVIPSRDLTDGHTSHPHLPTDHPLLVVARVPALASLRHKKPDSVH
jgi:hypothetical protein